MNKLVIGVVALAAIGGGAYYMMMSGETAPAAPAVPETIAPETAEAKIYIQPYMFETRDGSCSCQYLIENRTGKAIRKLRASIKLGNVPCDAGHISSEALADGALIVSKNLRNGQACDAVSTATFNWFDDCDYSGGGSCNGDDVVLVNSETVTWTE